MNQKIIIITLLVALAVGSGAFYAGMTYQKSRNGVQFMRRGDGQSGGGRQMGQGRMQGGGPNREGQNDIFVAGEIMAKDDKSVTIKTMDGGSKIIFFSDSTTIGKAVEGASSDLENGKQVMINGKYNQDGSFSAENIQIRPLPRPQE